MVYAGGSIMALIAGYRGLRLIEAMSLIAVPFLFNLLLTIGADWHMADLGALATAHVDLPFPVQVAIGRALALWFIGEMMLTLINLISVNRLPRSARTHGLFALSGVVAALTPLIANAAQLVAQPFLAIFFSSFCAALAQAGLWAIVYLLTGDHARLARRPPAALRGDLGALANRLRQRRDLRRAVHGLHPRRGSGPARARRARQSSMEPRS